MRNSKIRINMSQDIPPGIGKVMTQRSDPSDRDSSLHLKGTTLAVYRFMFRNKSPVGAHDIQRRLKLGSPSVAQYHLQKLLEGGLIREEEGKYVVNATIFENMIRIRRVALPYNVSYSIFFAGALVVLLTVLRPGSLSSTYYFALLALMVAFGTSVFEVARAFKGI